MTNGQAKFTDIKGHVMEQSILKAYQLGLISGYSDTMFAPNEKMTRQGVVVILCKLVSKLANVNIPTTSPSLAYYSDAAHISPWAAPYVDFAHSQNIMMGSNGKFNPGGAVTREQALVIIARLENRYDWG